MAIIKGRVWFLVFKLVVIGLFIFSPTQRISSPPAYLLSPPDTFLATAYCKCPKCCGIYANELTAFGYKPKELRTLAVDPRFFRRGEWVLVKLLLGGRDTLIMMRAEDTGNKKYICGKRVDIYFDSHRTASTFLQRVIIWRFLRRGKV